MSSFQQYHKIADKINVVHVWQMVLTTEQAPVADSDGKKGHFNKSYLLTVCMFVNYIISMQQQNLCIFMWILCFLLSLTIYCSTERYRSNPFWHSLLPFLMTSYVLKSNWLWLLIVVMETHLHYCLSATILTVAQDLGSMLTEGQGTCCSVNCQQKWRQK